MQCWLIEAKARFPITSFLTVGNDDYRVVLINFLPESKPLVVISESSRTRYQRSAVC
ncbi:hypothetical protein VCR15J2_310059 [Vibrio coralliirubri]|nr:hypothetical protein VCR15J2_310059 [Vibrio coralliirubri]